MRKFGKNTIKALILLIIVFVLSLMIAPSVQAENPIVGKWVQISGGNDKMEFFNDGTMIVYTPEMNFSGKYSFVGKNRLKFQLDGNFLGIKHQPHVAQVSYSGNIMTWIMTDGKAAKYRRVK